MKGKRKEMGFAMGLTGHTFEKTSKVNSTL